MVASPAQQQPVASPAAASSSSQVEKPKKRSLKKKVAPQEFGGPGRAKSGYMLFGDDNRTEVLKKLREECEAKGEAFKITLVGKRIGELWKAISPEDKKKYEERQKQVKEENAKATEAWKQTDSYKEFLKETEKHTKKQKKAKLDATLKEQGAPKRGASAYFMFSQSVTKAVIDELAKTGEKATMSQRAGVVKSKWEALSETEKKVFQDKALAEKTKYEADMKAFKEGDAYKKYVKELAKLNKKPSAKKRKGNDGAAIEEEDDVELGDLDEDEEEEGEEGEEGEEEEGEEAEE